MVALRFADDAPRIRDCVSAAYERQNAEGCVKVWEDIDRYHDVISLTRPELIIECGTHSGASATFFAALAPHVITIDVADAASSGLPVNVTAFTGRSSVDDDVITAVVNKALRYHRVMVVLDSDHSAAHVRAEIDAYGPLVTPGCYLVVEDGIARWMPGENVHGSPLDAIESRLYGNPIWTHDAAVQDMHRVTMYPEGWWVRNAC